MEPRLYIVIVARAGNDLDAELRAGPELMV